MNTNDARRAHSLLDNLSSGYQPSDDDLNHLRSFLPERPIQKGLEEIAWDIDFAWAETSGNDWKEELFGDLETWLSEQHTQLRAHLEGVKYEAHPEFLSTEGQYENAPEGTVVAGDGMYAAWTKANSKWGDNASQISSWDMAGISRRVLRWGGGVNEQL